MDRIGSKRADRKTEDCFCGKKNNPKKALCKAFSVSGGSCVKSDKHPRVIHLSQRQLKSTHLKITQICWCGVERKFAFQTSVAAPDVVWWRDDLFFPNPGS